MGNQIGDAVEGTLYYVALSEFERVRILPAQPAKRVALFATFSRINALYMITRAGSGHIGSSFSSLDIVSWLLLNEVRAGDGEPGDGARDAFFSSKGHDAPGYYAALIGLGRLDFDLLHKLRRLGGLPGHPDVSTPWSETNTGSLGMGISKAKGMIFANRLKRRAGNVYVMTGDGELQEGQIWESLASAANHGLHELIVVVDHNKLQSDTFVKTVSDLGDLEQKFASFGWHVERCDGHDLEAFAAVLERLKAVKDKPKIIIADTIKGRGISFMEHTALGSDVELYKYHSGAPGEEAYLKAVLELMDGANEQLRALGAPGLSLETAERPSRPVGGAPQRLVGAYSKALLEQARANPDIVVLDADLALDCGLLPFKDEFPERFVECGIAEQDMVSQAGGMALRGLLPVVHSFACFLSTRPNEQIYNNATERTKIVYVGSLAGLVPGGPGHSHQSVRDISTLAAVPGLVMIEPCNEAEVGFALDYCLNGTSESSYLRLVSVPWEVPFELPANYRLVEGRGVTLTEGNDAVIFASGPVMLSQAFEAARTLRDKHGIEVKVVNLPWLNRVDDDWLKETLRGVPWVFTVDNHYVAGGQGDILCGVLAEADLLSEPLRVHKFGLRDIPACGTNDEVLRAHLLDAESLTDGILAELRRA